DGVDGVELGQGGAAGTGVVDSYRTALILGRLIEQFRWRGHLSATLDPLDLAPRSQDADVILDLAALSLGDLEVRLEGNGASMEANSILILQRLKQIYCGTIGYEFMHVANATAREWLRNEIEAGVQKAG